MSEGKESEKTIQASHARWIRELQQSFKIIKQDLSSLEKRVSAFETEIAERAKVHRELKSEVSSLSAEVKRISAELECDSGVAEDGS